MKIVSSCVLLIASLASASAFISPALPTSRPSVRRSNAVKMENFGLPLGESPEEILPPSMQGEANYLKFVASYKPDSILIGGPQYPLIKRVSELKLLSLTAETGLLTRLEELGLKLSDLEKLLPLADELDLLPLAEQNKELILQTLAPIAIEQAPVLLPILVQVLKTPPAVFYGLAAAALAAEAGIIATSGNVFIDVLAGIPLVALAGVGIVGGSILSSGIKIPASAPKKSAAASAPAAAGGAAAKTARLNISGAKKGAAVAKKVVVQAKPKVESAAKAVASVPKKVTPPPAKAVNTNLLPKKPVSAKTAPLPKSTFKAFSRSVSTPPKPVTTSSVTPGPGKSSLTTKPLASVKSAASSVAKSVPKSVTMKPLASVKSAASSAAKSVPKSVTTRPLASVKSAASSVTKSVPKSVTTRPLASVKSAASSVTKSVPKSVTTRPLASVKSAASSAAKSVPKSVTMKPLASVKSAASSAVNTNLLPKKPVSAKTAPLPKSTFKAFSRSVSTPPKPVTTSSVTPGPGKSSLTTKPLASVKSAASSVAKSVPKSVTTRPLASVKSAASSAAKSVPKSVAKPAAKASAAVKTAVKAAPTPIKKATSAPAATVKKSVAQASSAAKQVTKQAPVKAKTVAAKVSAAAPKVSAAPKAVSPPSTKPAISKPALLLTAKAPAKRSGGSSLIPKAIKK